MIMKKLTITLAVSLACWTVAPAAVPPDLVNYQGVLRDNNGNPETGNFDMTFRFFDAAAGGNEILVDEHLNSGSGDVAVTGGLFDVHLGGGTVSDGVAALAGDPYDSLSKVFRDFTEVWMQIQIGVEMLSPRVRVAAAAYALNATNAEQATTASNADTLDGVDSGQFLRSDNSDTFTSGTLTTAAGTTIDVNGSLFLDGELFMDQDGPDGVQSIYFYHRGTPTGSFITWDNINAQFELGGGLDVLLDANVGGSATVAQDLTLGDDLMGLDDISFGAGAAINSSPGGLVIQAGDINLDNLLLSAGNSSDDGYLNILGDGGFEMGSGSGWFRWINNDTATEIATLDTVGNLQIDGNLEIDGDLHLNNLNSLWVGSGPVPVIGNYIFLLADEELQMSSEVGDFSWWESGGLRLLRLSSPGDLLVSRDLTVVGVARSDELEVEVIRGPGPPNHPPGSLSLHTNRSMTFTIDEDSNSATVDVFEWFKNGTTLGTDKLMELEQSGDLEIDGALSQGVMFDIAENFVSAAPIAPGRLVRVDPQRSNGVILTRGAYDAGVLGVVSETPAIVLGGTLFNVDQLDAWGADLKAKFLSEESVITTELLAQRPELEQLRARLETAEPADLESTAGQIPSEERDPARQTRAAELRETLRGAALDLFAERNFVPVALSGRLPVLVDASHGEIRPGDPLTPSPTPGVAMKATAPGPIIGTALEGFTAGTGKVLTLVHRGYYTPAEQIAETRQAQVELAGDVAERTPNSATGTHALAGNLQVVLDRNADGQARFSIFRTGGEDLASEVFRVDEDGNVFTKGAVRPRSTDIAEFFPVSEPVTAGDLLVVDRNAPGHYALGRAAQDAAVVGIVSEDPGVILGGDVSRILAADAELSRRLEEARAADDQATEAGLWLALQRRFRETNAPVALAGSVLVKADAGYGAIEPGDLLTSSPTAGHAMRADDPRAGTIVGKALEVLDSGTGMIRMLVMLR